MKYYKVISSHWPGEFEFKSELELGLDQCFRITEHDGFRNYPTRFKVIGISEVTHSTHNIVNILNVDTKVEAFQFNFQEEIYHGRASNYYSERNRNRLFEEA